MNGNTAFSEVKEKNTFNVKLNFIILWHQIVTKKSYKYYSNIKLNTLFFFLWKNQSFTFMKGK